MSGSGQRSADHRPVHFHAISAAVADDDRARQGTGGGALLKPAVQGGWTASRAVGHGRAAAYRRQVSRPDADPWWRDHHAALHERAELTGAGITPAGRRNGQATGQPGGRGGAYRTVSLFP